MVSLESNTQHGRPEYVPKRSGTIPQASNQQLVNMRRDPHALHCLNILITNCIAENKVKSVTDCTLTRDKSHLLWLLSAFFWLFWDM